MSASRRKLFFQSEFLDAIKKYVEENPDLTLYMGFGWKPYAFPATGPTRHDLDAITCLGRPLDVAAVSAQAHDADFQF